MDQAWPAEVGSPEAVLAAFNQPGVMLFVVEGPDLVVRAANAGAALFSGRGGMVGRLYADLVPAAQDQGLGELFRRVMETGEPVETREWRVETEHPGSGRAVRYASIAMQPWLAADGNVRGVLACAVDVGEEVTRRRSAEAAKAASEARYRAARDLALTLQDSLLPGALPVVQGLQTAGRYLLAQDDTAAGGDWLDVVPLPDGLVALVVGDVVGHGVGASALMGQLRAVVGERLAAGVGITASLESLDRMARRSPEAHAATVAVAEVDPASGRVSYCTAGHPPPLVVGREGARFLEPSGARPLATDGDFPVAEERLGDDELLLLYSDGLIERPGRVPAKATVELARVAGRVTRGEAPGADLSDAPLVDRLCQQTLELLTWETGYADDITMLAAQRVTGPEPMEISHQALPAALEEVRRAVTDWLAPLSVRPLDAMALQHAVGECVTNAIDHAYADLPETTDRPVRVSLALDRPGLATVTVADRGAWQYGPREETGRGLQMVNTLTEQVSIDRRSDGTTITLSSPLARSVGLLQAEPGAGPVSRDGIFEATQSEGLLEVRGAVDLSCVDDFRSTLLRLIGGRLPEVRVDLSGLSLLASCGVQALYDVVDRAERQGITLRLVAAPASVAQHVLELVGLPYEAPDDVGSSDPN